MGRHTLERVVKFLGVFSLYGVKEPLLYKVLQEMIKITVHAGEGGKGGVLEISQDA